MKLHLPKMLLMVIISSVALSTTTAYGGDIISVNFTHGGDNISVSEANAGQALNGVTASGWQNVAAANASDITVNNQSGTAVGTMQLQDIQGSWKNGGGADNLYSEIQKGYIDVSNHTYGIFTISVDHDFWISDVTIYMGGDTTEKYAPMEVNGQTYIGGTNQIATSSDGWGSSNKQSDTSLYREFDSNNSITVTETYGDLIVRNTYPKSNIRGTVAGIQIVDRTAEKVYFTTLGSAVQEAGEVIWSLNGTETDYADIADGAKYLGVTAAAEGSSLNFAANESLEFIGVKENTLNITSDGSIAVKTLYTAKEDSVINLNATLTSNLTVAGLGLVNINTNQALNNLTVSGTMNVGEGVEVSVRNTDAGFLSNTIGKGTVNLEETARYNGSMSSAFAGIINVAAGKSIYLGDNQADEYDLSDATIKLNKGSRFELQSVGSQLNKLDVADTSTLHVEDGDTGATALRINSVDIAAGKSLIVTNHWEGDLIIENLNAEGSLDLQTSRPEAFKVYLGTDSDSALNIGATISNTGALTVNGSITITNDLSAFVIHTQAADGTLTENEGQDGYMTTIGSTYYLVDNSDSGTCTFTPTTAIYDGKTINLTQDATTGDVTFVGGTSIDTVYRVNTKDVIVGGTSATDNTGRATAFIVAQGRAVTIADGSDAASASDILLNSSGDGNVILAKDTTIEGGQQTQVTGKLTINDGVTLTVGTGYTDRSNISSFKGGVELAGGSLMINGAGQEVNSLTVSKASTLGIANQWQRRQTYTLTGTTRLNADLEYTNSVAGEHGELVIKNLSGSGVLSTNGGSSTWGANALKVEKLTEYTGTIKVDGGNRADNRNYVEFGTSTTEGDVTTKASAFTTLKGLELTNKAYATVHSTGNSTIEKVVLNNGSLEYTSNGGGYTYTLGDVTSEGASSISTDSGRVEIDKLTLNSGQLSMTGSLTIGELVLDLSRYTDMSQSYTLVTATGEGASVGLTNAYSSSYNGYTATVSGSGSTSLTLSFEKIDWSLTGAPAYDELSNMLTLNVNADLQGYDFTENGAIIIPGIGDAMMKDILGLSGLPGDGLVGITLVGADGAKVTASGDNQIGFQGNGGIYYGQAGTGNVDWVYQAAYIPEPATTTLSLLALTALAARRRRK